MSIKSAVKGYVKQGLKRWHTPGHKGMLSKEDITEIGNDGELFPADEIDNAQRRAAAFYGAKFSRFLVCGSSMGVKAAIMSAGGNILAARGRHPCADEGAALARVKLYEMDNAIEDGLYLPPTLKQVEEAMDAHPDAAAVLIVSPDYYGRTASESIATSVRKRGKLLIADSAHGAHFAARKDLFGEGFSSLADCCVMSAHKTLRAYTQSAYLCVNSDKLIDSIDYNLRLLGTTSPSYLLLGGLDEAIQRAGRDAYKYDGLLAAVEDFKKSVVCARSDDFTRIVVDAAAYGLTGETVYCRLLKDGHSAEKYDEKRVVFIVTAADEPSDVESLKQSVLRAVHER